MTGNCDIWADVDFGHGPVEVRCTQTGEHKYHKCELAIYPEKIPGEIGYKKPSATHSVFDDASEPVETGKEVTQRKREDHSRPGFF